MSAGVVGIVGALAVVVVVLRLVVRRKLLVKYAALWLVVSVVLVVMAAIPRSLRAIADLLGFAVPANLLFFAGFVLILLVTLQLSTELTVVESHVQRLAEEIAIMQEKDHGPVSAEDAGAGDTAEPRRTGDDEPGGQSE